MEKLERFVLNGDPVNVLFVPRVGERRASNPLLQKWFLEVFIEVLLAGFAKERFSNALLKSAPSTASTTIDTHHVAFFVVQVGVEKLGDYMGVPKFTVMPAKNTE